MTPRLRRFLIVALLVLPLAGLLAWVARAQTPGPAAATATATATTGPDEAPRPAQPPLPVVLGPVTQASDGSVLELPGSGLASRSVTLYPAAAGEVRAVGFAAGQRVRAGEVLLQLDDRQQRLAVELAEAQLQAARQLLARYAATRGTGAVPGNLIDEAESSVRLAEIALRQAREALADRSLRAPFAGVVGIAGVEAGDRVGTDTTVTTLDDRRSLQVAFELPEAHAARLQRGQTLTVRSPAFGERDFPGRVAQIDSRVDAATRALRLRAEVPNGEDLLRPGMSFQVRLALEGARYPAVPELALQWGREGAFVWAVRDSRATRVPVRAVRRNAGQVLLEGPLAAGEQVVVEGVQRLREGAPVRVLNPKPVGPAAPARTAP